MIDYVVNNAFGCIVYQNALVTQYKMSNLSYIKKMCIAHLFTYEGYLKAVQKNLGKRYKIPVAINSNTLFIPLKRSRDYDNIWVNFASITDIHELDHSIEVVFVSKRKLYLDISMKSLRKQIKYLEAINNVKVKHFHF